MSLEYILNICYFGWILNFGLYVVMLLVLVTKVALDIDNLQDNRFKLNLYSEQVQLKKSKNRNLAQKILGWVIPYYLALSCSVSISYLLLNFKRNIVDVAMELDYIQDSYRIFKRH